MATAGRENQTMVWVPKELLAKLGKLLEQKSDGYPAPSKEGMVKRALEKEIERVDGELAELKPKRAKTG